MTNKIQKSHNLFSVFFLKVQCVVFSGLKWQHCISVLAATVALKGQAAVKIL